MADPVSKAQFADLYAATVRDILTYLRRRTGRDVEDLAAEVYAIAWRKRTTMPEPDMRRAWLFGIARNLLKVDRRQQERDSTVVEDLTTHSVVVRDQPTSNTKDVVTGAMGRLSPEHRDYCG